MQFSWDTFQSLYLWIGGLFVTAVLWFLRNILTNGKRIDLLEQDRKHARAQRDQDRQDMIEVRRDVAEIKTILMQRDKE